MSVTPHCSRAEVVLEHGQRLTVHFFDGAKKTFLGPANIEVEHYSESFNYFGLIERVMLRSSVEISVECFTKYGTITYKYDPGMVRSYTLEDRRKREEEV